MSKKITDAHKQVYNTVHAYCIRSEISEMKKQPCGLTCSTEALNYTVRIKHE